MTFLILQSMELFNNTFQGYKVEVRCLDKLTVFKRDMNHTVDLELIKLSCSEFQLPTIYCGKALQLKSGSFSLKL